MAKKPVSLQGNPNSLKHGFYSPLFRTGPDDDLLPDSTSLEHEITLLRVMIRRTMQLAEGLDDLREAMRLLDALGAAAARLANLLRAQKSLAEYHSQVADEISDAMQRVNNELRSKR